MVNSPGLAPMSEPSTHSPRRIAGWALVGALGVLVGLGLLYVLVTLFRLPVPLASLLNAAVMLMLRFWANNRWVFGRSQVHWADFQRYCAASAGGFVVWYLTLNGLAWAGVHYLLAALLAVGCSVTVNFTTNFFWVWGNPPLPAPEADSRRRNTGALAKLAGTLGAATLLVHHAAFWIDHVLWDEVSFEKMAADGDLSGKLQALIDQRIPSVYYFYALFAHLPEPTWLLRVANLFSLWLTATCVAAVLLDYGRVSRRSATMAGLLVVCYPAYQLYANAGATIYVVCLAFFAAGSWCFFRGLRTPTANRWWLVVAAAAWVGSFLMQSLFVYCYAVMTVGLLVAWDQEPPWQRPDRAQVTRFYGWFALAPVINYQLLRLLFDLHPYFGSAGVGYNVPHFDPVPLGRDFLASLSSTLIAPIMRSLRGPELMAAAAGAVFSLWLGKTASRPSLPMAVPHRAWRLQIAGALLLGAAILPYAAVGKPPQISGVQTRFAILVAPSLAVLVAGVMETCRGVRARRIASAVVGALLGAFAMQHARAYVDWQLCAIKDQACIAALRRLPPPVNTAYFFVRGDHLEHTYAREFYDWGYIFHRAWGGYHRIGLPEGRPPAASGPSATSFGLSRDLIANFSRWMGYGDSAAADNVAVIAFEESRDFASLSHHPWSAVARDLAARVHLGLSTREQLLTGYVPSARIESVTRPLADATQLPLLPLRSTSWLVASTRPLLSSAGAAPHVTVHGADGGLFEVLPAGTRGLLVRYQALVAPAPPAEIAVRVEIPSPMQGASARWGMALRITRHSALTPPRLVLVSAGGLETEGEWTSSTADWLEVWNPAGTVPVCAWILWRPKSTEERLTVRELHAGWSPSPGPRL